MVRLKTLPYWARIGASVGLIGAGYFFASAVIAGVTGAGISDILFDLLLAGVFVLLALAIMAKATPKGASGVSSTKRRMGPLDY